MKRLVLVALLVGLLLGADDPKNNKGKKGTTALDGTWEVVSATENGKARKGVKGGKVVFKGKDLTINTPVAPERKGTFKMDPKKETIDVTFADQKGTFRGIYSLKGDQLKVCVARPEKDRAQDFTARKGSARSLIVLKRAKDKGDKKEKELAAVEGKILLDGQPLAKADLIFVPVDNKGQKATGTTHDDGSFELTTGGNKKGAAPGEYKIVVTKKVAGKSLLRKEYSSEKTTPLMVTVQKGRNQFDIQLKSR